MKTIELTPGTIEYTDTGGDGPVIVLLHGLLMDASLWDASIAELGDEFRCVAPTMPLGAHSYAMNGGADLSLPSIALLVTELLDRLELSNVTLVGSDTGGAVAQLLMCQRSQRIDRAVLVSCDAFDNFPPGLTGKTAVLLGKLPAFLFGVFMQQLRLRPFRRLPIAFGWLTKRGDEATKRWVQPVIRIAAIRRDAVKALRAVDADRDLLVNAARSLPGFGGPVLVVWASQDRVMPLEHGHRLVELLPHAHLIEIADSYTLIPLDQPARLAAAIGDFAREPATST